MKQEIEETYSRIAMLLFGIMIGWILSTTYVFLSFIVSVFGLLILGVVYIFHKLKDKKE